MRAEKLPVDGRSDLTGGAASLAYTPGPGLRELRTDEHWDAAPDDGARWELRSPFTKGYNVVTLSHYVFALDDRAAVAAFVAGKDREQSGIAGFRVSHHERVVDGRTGYVWEYRSHRGYWQFAAWFRPSAVIFMTTTGDRFSIRSAGPSAIAGQAKTTSNGLAPARINMQAATANSTAAAMIGTNPLPRFAAKRRGRFTTPTSRSPRSMTEWKTGSPMIRLIRLSGDFPQARERRITHPAVVRNRRRAGASFRP